MATYISLISYYVVSHLGCQPLPPFTEMAAMTFLWKIENTPKSGPIVNLSVSLLNVDCSHYQK